jgi:hypothetical protein
VHQGGCCRPDSQRPRTTSLTLAHSTTLALSLLHFNMVKVVAVVSALFATTVSAAVIAPAAAGSDNVEIAKRDNYGDGERFRAPSLHSCLIYSHKALTLRLDCS